VVVGTELEAEPEPVALVLSLLVLTFSERICGGRFWFK